MEFACQLGFVVGYVLHRIDHEVKTLDGVVESRCAHGDNTGFGIEIKVASLICALEVACGERVAYHAYLLAGHDAAIAATLCQPVAHCHEVQLRGIVVEASLGSLYRGRHVAAFLSREGATLADAFIGVAFIGVMAHAGAVPHVVHGPYHSFAHSHQFLERAHRHHTLVNPVEDNHIGGLGPRVPGQVQAVRGIVNLEQCAAVETVAHEDVGALGKEVVSVAPLRPHSLHMRVGTVAVNHKHACAHALLVKGAHESGRCYCRTAQMVAPIYQQNVHCYLVWQS